MSNEAIERLRVDLKSKQTDLFRAGDVIRWRAADRFWYAAIKADTGVWFTTSRQGNSYVAQTLDYDDLVEALGRSEAAFVCVASAWEPLAQEVDPLYAES